MASRSRRKRAVRAERLQREAAERELASRQARARFVIVAVAVAAVLVMGLVAVSQQRAGRGGDAGSVEGAAETSRSLRGIPQSGLVLGNRGAPVRIIEFGDLQCPACKVFAEEELPKVIDDEVRSGRATFEYRQLVILGPESRQAAIAALAASKQDRYWQYLGLFYRNQGIENSGYVTPRFLEAVARSAGVDVARWKRDLDDPAWDGRLTSVQSAAEALGINSTPSFRVEGAGGRAATPADFSAGAIARAVERVRE